MKMACTFCPQGRAVPAFYGTRNLPASAGHAVGKQSRAWNPRFLILRDQLLRVIANSNTTAHRSRSADGFVRQGWLSYTAETRRA
jgi:hypothetical protein